MASTHATVFINALLACAFIQHLPLPYFTFRDAASRYHYVPDIRISSFSLLNGISRDASRYIIASRHGRQEEA